MKQDDFRKWLVARGQSEVTASSRASSVRRVEQYLGDLDDLFVREDLDSILSRFAYSTEDEKAGRPNPSPVPIDGVLRTGLASIQQALKLYHFFVTEKGKGTASADPFSRNRIERAMDAYEQFQISGAHAEAFTGFGAPSEYWVRSSRSRGGKPFPTKPIVGYMLGKAANTFNGGWSQPGDAAARLHAAGYIIVDQNDVPLPLPERHKHLMRGAKRARLVALNYFIQPARDANRPSVAIRAGELHDMCGLIQNWANVCQALEGEKFQALASVPPPTRLGPERSTTTEYTFVLTGDSTLKEKTMPQAVATETTNLILYGPPGTGKTYRTAWEAVRLCLGDVIADELSGEERRGQLMEQYRRLVDDGRIEFVTFHQSMSYEEFVEGLRPETHHNAAEEREAATGFSLAPHDGVFKRLSDRARLSAVGTVSSDGRVRLDPTRRVFKMSLGNTAQPEGDALFDACDRDGRIRMGYNLGVDWSDGIYGDVDEIHARSRQVEGQQDLSRDSGLVSFQHTLRNVIETGDTVLISRGLKKLRAIGVVTGPYNFDAEGAGDYPHERKVHWFWVSKAPETDIDVETFYPNDFSPQTLYQLQKPIDWPHLLTAAGLASDASADSFDPAPAYVLIIDEINRANISKVFGELITLLETDKRLGLRNEILVTLPYSKQRFGVPVNLHIIGTMNTADRSIALLDTALRRRFTFKELMPDPSVLSTNPDGVNLQELLTTINERIEYLFDREHQIGHAYFKSCETLQAIEDAMRHKVIPLLSEYFYEDWSKVAAVLGDGPQGPSRFLEALPLARPPGIAADDFTGERLRWRMKDQFDFTEFKA